MGTANEIRAEQQVVDTLYQRLDELYAVTRRRLSTVRREGPTGSPQNRSERDAFATLYEDRLAQLEAVEDRLVFGRLDLEDQAVRYVGRLGLTDEQHQSLLTDWRAPAAQAFYRATSAHREGVTRRRHLITRARRVTGIEDELLDLSGTTHAGELSGEGALLAALSSGRTGQMSDIVATIQAEQDLIIRSPLQGALVVQGGPGTGKTAVALHRAAYLLYAHRRTLERSGVLLVGPSRHFLRYIDQVLPSLGETGVVSSTIDDLIPGVHVSTSDSEQVSAIKGRRVFARIIERAVQARQRIPEQDIPTRVEGHDVVIRRKDVRDAIAKARRSQKPHNQARVVFVREMLNRLVDQVNADLGFPISPEDRALMIQDLREDRTVRVALNLAWFPMTPERLISDLWSKPHRLAEAGPELNAAERAALFQASATGWSAADIPLLDEAAELLGEDDETDRLRAAAAKAERAQEIEYARHVLDATGQAHGLVDAENLADRFAVSSVRGNTADRAAKDRSWTYGHIVVDEAQELSAMAWRMLLRRCPTRSMTIVGDVAQTSSSSGSRSWSHTLDRVLRDSWRLTELTVNYRTPATIADMATQMARAADLPISTITSARDVPHALDIQQHTPERCVDEALKVAGIAVTQYVNQAAGTGRIAIIAGASHRDALRSRLASDPLAQGFDPIITVAAPREVKGLEYDAVVVVEPHVLLAESHSAADLYVAMTRPTQQLTIVHHLPLPSGMLYGSSQP